jgi:hypothetical protein
MLRVPQRLPWLKLALRLDRCGRIVQVRSGKRALFFGDGKQGRIELDKRGVHCRMLCVTTVAVGGGRDCLCRLPAIKGEERPFTRKTRLVLYVELKSHDIGGLKISVLIDGAFPLGSTHLKNQHRLVRPGAAGDKSFVRFGIHKDVVEDVVVTHLHRGVNSGVLPNAPDSRKTGGDRKANALSRRATVLPVIEAVWPFRLPKARPPDAFNV